MGKCPRRHDCVRSLSSQPQAKQKSVCLNHSSRDSSLICEQVEMIGIFRGRLCLIVWLLWLAQTQSCGVFRMMLACSQELSRKMSLK